MEQAQPSTPTVSTSIHVFPGGLSTSVWAPTEESKDEETQPTKIMDMGWPILGTSTGGFDGVHQRGRTFDTSCRRRIPVRADSFGYVPKTPEIVNKGGGNLFAVDADVEILKSSLSPARRPNLRKRLPLSRTPSVSSGSEESKPESPCYLTSERIKGFQAKSSSNQAPTIHYESILQDHDKINQELDRTTTHGGNGRMFEAIDTSNDLTSVDVASALNQDLETLNMFSPSNLIGVTDNHQYEEPTLSMLEAKVQPSEQHHLLSQYLPRKVQNSRTNNKLSTEVLASGNLYGKLGSVCITYDLTWELIQAAYLTTDSPKDLWDNPRRAPSPPGMPRADESLRGNSSDQPPVSEI